MLDRTKGKKKKGVVGTSRTNPCFLPFLCQWGSQRGSQWGMLLSFLCPRGSRWETLLPFLWSQWRTLVPAPMPDGVPVGLPLSVPAPVSKAQLQQSWCLPFQEICSAWLPATHLRGSCSTWHLPDRLLPHHWMSSGLPERFLFSHCWTSGSPQGRPPGRLPLRSLLYCS